MITKFDCWFLKPPSTHLNSTNPFLTTLTVIFLETNCFEAFLEVHMVTTNDDKIFDSLGDAFKIINKTFRGDTNSARRKRSPEMIKRNYESNKILCVCITRSIIFRHVSLLLVGKSQKRITSEFNRYMIRKLATFYLVLRALSDLKIFFFTISPMMFVRQLLNKMLDS